jgi:hypothetical protein
MLLFLQDLIERAASARAQQSVSLPERFVEMPAGTPTVHRAPLPSDVGGLSFDPRELILALFEQETSDKVLNEIVSAAEHDLISNGLNFLCQSSPTLCNTVKHMRANANSMMQTLHQQLAVLESKLPGLTRIIKAEIIQGCLEEKLKKGVPVPKAARECLNPKKLKSLAGKICEELDFAHEIASLFNLSAEDEEFLSRILRHVKIRPDGIEVELAKPGVERVYWQLREKYYDRWRRAFEGIKEGRINELFFYDGPPHRPRLERHEVERISALPEWLQVRIASTSSSAMAYYELEEKVAKIDEYLAETAQAPGASEGIRKAAQSEREELVRQMKKLDAENERNLRLQEALLASRDAADVHVARVVTSRINQMAANQQREKTAAESLKPCCTKETKK